MGIEYRWLIHVFPLKQNCALLIRFAERSNYKTQPWLSDINELDAIGIAVSSSGSVRFYSQNSNAIDTPYYQGYKFYPDHPPRIDEYYLCPFAEVLTSDFVNGSSISKLLQLTQGIISQYGAKDLITLKIQSEKRHSAFIQCEFSTFCKQTVNENVKQTIKLCCQDNKTVNIYERYFTHAHLNHIAYGRDNINGIFVTFYYASDVQELQSIAANH